MESKIYKTLLIEVRPRLQSVNVFLILLNNNNKCEVKLNVDNFELSQNECKEIIKLDDLQIIITSLSSFMARDKYLSFRFATNNNLNFGTFKTELLAINDNLANIDINKSDTFVKKNVIYDIICKNCSQEFCKALNFQRILPLPSDNAEPGDYFCHASPTLENCNNLDPKINDLFYNQCYFHLNKSIIKNIVENCYISCKRCLSWVGIKINDETCKFWFNTINFVDEKGIKLSTTPLNDSFATLRAFLKESLLNSTKIVLSCQVNDFKVDYLLLWVMEKKLNVFLSYNCVLKDKFMGKVLFKFESGSTDLVKKWLDDVAISNVAISKPMMVHFLKHLYQMNALIPKEYSISNDFYISYVDMYDT